MLEKKHYNRVIAELIEPDPPDITTDEWGQPIIEGKSVIPPFLSSTFSPNEAWVLVEIYGEGDIPRWQHRYFDRDFETAVGAFDKIIGQPFKLSYDERCSESWELTKYHVPFEEFSIYGDTAAEVICEAIIRWGSK